MSGMAEGSKEKSMSPDSVWMLKWLSIYWPSLPANPVAGMGFPSCSAVTFPCTDDRL